MQPLSRAQIRVELMNTIGQVVGRSLPQAQFQLGPIAWKAPCGGRDGCEWHLPDLQVVPEYDAAIRQAIDDVRSRHPIVICWQTRQRPRVRRRR